MKAGSIPYTFVGSPEKDEGIEFVSPEKLRRYLDDPKIREAVDRVEKHDFGGKPSGAKMMVRRELVNDLSMRLRVESQRRVIDLAKAKHEGRV